ncbi:hypothetical protein VPH35_112980 [Triticum aestivum]
MAASSPQWSSLLPELLGQVIPRLPRLADHARFRAVCRSWRSAMRLHGSPRQGLPWIVLEYGAYQALPDSRLHQLPLSWNVTCVGATDNWIALDHVDYVALVQKHTCTLYNHFSGVTVPLPELDSVIGKVHEKFEIRKVLMRSTPDDLFAVTGNIWKYPLILCRPGKRAWVARPLVMPYFRIVDFAFLGHVLYAITKAENVYAIHLAEDDEGNPRVSFVKRITRHTPYEIDNDNDHSYAYNGMLPACVEFVNQGRECLVISRHLVESHGKLLMVRWQCLVLASTPDHPTRKVEVFEADVDKGTWVPVANGLGGGQAMFIREGFNKIVSARGEVKEDVIYFPHTNDVLDMQTGIIGSLGLRSHLYARWMAWVFPPDLVI